MQPVKTHSTAFNQGQRFVTKSRSVPPPPPVHSVLILSRLSHTHALWLSRHSSPPPLLAGRSPGASLDFGLSAAWQKAESLQLVGTPAPLGCHSGICTAPSSLLLHFLPLPPLLFPRYTCHTNNRRQCTNLPRAITSLGIGGFS